MVSNRIRKGVRKRMSGYCKHCDSLTNENDIVKLYDSDHNLVWTGCFDCFEKQRPALNWAYASNNLKELRARS